MQGYKIIRQNHTHYGFTYKEGLNIDTKPFQPEGSCVAGGLYFFTDLEDLSRWLDYGVYLYDVEVPKGYKYVQEYSKHRAEALYLSNRLDLRLAQTWEYLLQKVMYSPRFLYWASHYGYIEVINYFVNTGANIREGNDRVLRTSILGGYTDIIKLFLDICPDLNNYARYLAKGTSVESFVREITSR